MIQTGFDLRQAFDPNSGLGAHFLRPELTKNEAYQRQPK
jgi:hypothetical protein